MSISSEIFLQGIHLGIFFLSRLYSNITNIPSEIFYSFITLKQERQEWSIQNDYFIGILVIF